METIRQDIIKAWVFLRQHNHTIPDNVLDFMKKASLEKLEELERENKPFDFRLESEK